MRVGGDNAFLDGFGKDPFAVDAAPVVRDADQDPARAVFSGKDQGSFGRLACGQAISRVFDAVIDGIADQMGERFAQPFDHGLVELGGLADQFEPDLLAGRSRKLAQDARHPAEHRADRLGADRHGAFLDLAGQPVEQGQLFAGRNTFAGKPLRHHGLGNHQFADRIDQAIKLGQIDTD